MSWNGATLACLVASLFAGGAHAQTAPPVAEEDLPPLGTGPSVQMTGALGNYSMMRDAFGTSWQPESSTMEGIHGIYDDWATMLHGYASLIYDNQGGRRGDNKTFSSSMLMGVAQRMLGEGTLTLRGMLSTHKVDGKYNFEVTP